MSPKAKDDPVKMLYISAEGVLHFNGLSDEFQHLNGKVTKFKNGGLADAATSISDAFDGDERFDRRRLLPGYTQKVMHDLEIDSSQFRRLTNEMQEHNVFFGRHRSFGLVPINERGVLKTYENFDNSTQSIRAIALAGIVENILSTSAVPYDVVWGHEGAAGLATAVARSHGIPTIGTNHNLHSVYVQQDELERLASFDVEEVLPHLYFEHDSNRVDTLATLLKDSTVTTVSEGFRNNILKRASHLHAPNYVFDLFDQAANNPEKGFYGISNAPINPDSEFLRAIETNGMDSVISNQEAAAKEFANKLGVEYDPELLTVAWINRIDPTQKNPGMYISAMSHFAKEMGVRAVMIADPVEGNQESRDLQKWAKNLSKNNPNFIYTPFGDGTLEPLAYQSKNVMTSLTSDYEPGGLPPINGGILGTLSLVHAVDGLELVTAMDHQNNQGLGFPYWGQTLEGFQGALHHAKNFSQLPDEVQYAQKERVAREILQKTTQDNIPQFRDIAYRVGMSHRNNS